MNIKSLFFILTFLATQNNYCYERTSASFYAIPSGKEIISNIGSSNSEEISDNDLVVNFTILGVHDVEFTLPLRLFKNENGSLKTLVYYFNEEKNLDMHIIMSPRLAKSLQTCYNKIKGIKPKSSCTIL